MRAVVTDEIFIPRNGFAFMVHLHGLLWITTSGKIIRFAGSFSALAHISL